MRSENQNYCRMPPPSTRRGREKGSRECTIVSVKADGSKTIGVILRPSIFLHLDDKNDDGRVTSKDTCTLSWLCLGRVVVQKPTNCTWFPSWIYPKISAANLPLVSPPAQSGSLLRLPSLKWRAFVFSVALQGVSANIEINTIHSMTKKSGRKLITLKARSFVHKIIGFSLIINDFLLISSYYWCPGLLTIFYSKL